MAFACYSLFLILCFIVSAAPSFGSSTADEPLPHIPLGGADCATPLYDMKSNCWGYIRKNNTMTVPDSCCHTLRSVLSRYPECLCEIFFSGGYIDFDIDITKGFATFDACNVRGRVVSSCRDVVRTTGASSKTSSSTLIVVALVVVMAIAL
ncbi:unnamed protein product [Linum trigynum]|uniref:Bifunctional inhibitor/plant lipid transfer protein/seed storage helical domain-containing protein n=1 Tax=Linum trigynum TaxID=586398 RepID=A0AAV2GR89_9ROSI